MTQSDAWLVLLVRWRERLKKKQVWIVLLVPCQDIYEHLCMCYFFPCVRMWTASVYATGGRISVNDGSLTVVAKNQSVMDKLMEKVITLTFSYCLVHKLCCLFLIMLYAITNCCLIVAWMYLISSIFDSNFKSSSSYDLEISCILWQNSLAVASRK